MSDYPYIKENNLFQTVSNVPTDQSSLTIPAGYCYYKLLL